MNKEKNAKIRGSWYTVNIKALTNQTTENYIRVFKKLIENDPLVPLQGSKHISIDKFDYVGGMENPRMIILTLCAYDIMDPDAFYDIKKKQQVMVDISPDVVSNKKDGVLYFVPKTHRLMILKSSKISLKQVVKYFTIGFEMIEEKDEFDVNVEVSSELIETIKNSHILYSLEAQLSYSNSDPSEGFVKLFGGEVKDAGAEKVDIKMRGGKGRSLKAKDDGLIDAILQLVKSNGTAKARIKKTQESSPETVETKDFPEIVHLEGKQDNLLTVIVKYLTGKFGTDGREDKS